MPKYKARILVNLRPSVLDPAGEAVRAAAARLGVQGVDRLRIGKSIEIEIQAQNELQAKDQLELLGDRLLANPVIEDWEMQLQTINSATS